MGITKIIGGDLLQFFGGLIKLCEKQNFLQLNTNSKQIYLIDNTVHYHITNGPILPPKQWRGYTFFLGRDVSWLITDK